jgi:hypothetical protein
MEVVWRSSAKTLEYGICGVGRYGWWGRRRAVIQVWALHSGQLNGGKDVSQRVIGIHVRVIVNAGGFVTIATALQSFFARMRGWQLNVGLEEQL